MSDTDTSSPTTDMQQEERDHSQWIAQRRAARTLQHISPSTHPCASSTPIGLVAWPLGSSSALDHTGNADLKWNGWGFTDTSFLLNDKGQVYVSGTRYLNSGIPFPAFRPWAEQVLGIDMKDCSPAREDRPALPPPLRSLDFEGAVRGHCHRLSLEDKDRYHHAHGHTCEEIYWLRYAQLERYPDMVVWPRSHEDVEVIVKTAAEFNVAVIPFGGGTSVSHGLLCPAGEKRVVVSVDMHEMNRIKWIDYSSLTACIECGVVGKDLDEKLAKLGFLVGHEPDSFEFSSLGGWIATRASGMKKNVYGNIEDILVNAKMVTPTGIIERGCNVPRMSSGPDLNQVIIGSEGTLGIITEAVVKLRPHPEIRTYGSIVFPDLASGVAFMREVARERCAPASIRLVDNLQFQLSQTLKPEPTLWHAWVDAAKKLYVLKYKGFDQNQMVAVTLLFEGNKVDVKAQEQKVYAICDKHNGLKGGEDNGKRGYFLTYMIAYIRDFAYEYNFMAESFETSVPWSQTLELCQRVTECIRRSVKAKGVTHPPFATCRVTQVYDAGACVYFYFGFVYKGLADPLKVYMEVEAEARDEILRCGGSISHHHGIGKLRKKWMQQSVSETGMNVLKGLKNTLDPQNIFACGNLIDI